jgi:hypothetical protein
VYVVPPTEKFGVKLIDPPEHISAGGAFVSLGFGFTVNVTGMRDVLSHPVDIIFAAAYAVTVPGPVRVGADVETPLSAAVYQTMV